MENSTKDAAVDRLIEAAEAARDLPVGEHLAVYAEVLAGLKAELDADPETALRAAP